MLGCCLISGIHMLITEYPEQGTHSGKTAITPFYGLISHIEWWPVSPAMPVWPDSTMLCLYAAAPLSFMNLLWLLSSLQGFLLSSSCLWANRCSSLYPSGLLIHRVVSVWGCCLNMEAILVPITLVLRLTGRKQLALSLASLYGTGADALDKLLLFLSILILALYSFILREVTKREPI